MKTEMGELDLLRQRQLDLEWALALAGKAIGIGVLFLPLLAGHFGGWVLLAATVIALPLAWLSQRTLTHCLLGAHSMRQEISQVIAEAYSPWLGRLFNLVLLVLALAVASACAIALTNLVGLVIDAWLQIEAVPRPIRSLLLALALSAIFLTTQEVLLLRGAALATYPLTGLLLFLALYFIPDWQARNFGPLPGAAQLTNGLLQLVPLLVFSLSFFSLCAKLAFSYQRHYADNRKLSYACHRPLFIASLLVMLFTLLFTFSCLLANPRPDLALALVRNVDILSWLSLYQPHTVLGALLLLVAAATLGEAFFLAAIQARRAALGLWQPLPKTPPPTPAYTWKTSLLLCLLIWLPALKNIPVLTVLGRFALPPLALLCCLMPVALLWGSRRQQPFRSASDWLVLAGGLLLLAAFWLAPLQ